MTRRRHRRACARFRSRRASCWRASSERLCAKRRRRIIGSPDKEPAARLETMRLAGEAQRAVHVRHPDRHRRNAAGAHRRAAGAARSERRATATSRKSSSRISGPSPARAWRMRTRPMLDDHLWTIAVARLIFEPAMNIQAPPNLSPGALGRLVAAGINDWGGVSPVTPDHVNPEAPWPHLRVLEAATKAAGKELVERLAIYPAFAREPRALARSGPAHAACCHRIDADGMPRVDDWCPGHVGQLPPRELDWIGRAALGQSIARSRPRAGEGAARRGAWREPRSSRLFRARGDDFAAVCRAADELRRDVNGDVVSYVVTRNINYTNICSFRCQFCAFSKGKMSENLRGRPYDLRAGGDRRTASREAWAARRDRSLHAGRHPSRPTPGRNYLEICRAVKAAVPRDARARVLAAGNLPGRADARHSRHRIPARAEGGRPRHAARHRGRNSRRRGARGAVPRQDPHRSNGST